MVNNKVIKKILMFGCIYCLFLVSCKKLDDEYNVDRLRENVWNGKTNELSIGYADKLFVLELNNDILVDNVSA